MKDTTIASNFNIKYYLNHEKFITDFSQEDILMGFDLYTSNEFNILEENDDRLIIGFKNNDILKFNFNKKDFSYVSNVLDIKEKELVCSFLYLYYKQQEIDDILNLYRFSLNYSPLDFISLLIKTYSYLEMIKKNYNFDDLKRYIVLVSDINIRRLTNIQRDMYFKRVFSFDIKIDDEEYKKLFALILNVDINDYNIKGLFYLGETIFKITDRARAYQFYSFLEKRARQSGVTNAKKKYIDYLKSRLLYEYIDTKIGLEQIENNYYNNNFIMWYYSKILEENNEEMPERIFINKGNFNIDDLEVVEKYINNWEYSVKEKILLKICNSTNITSELESTLKLLSDSELKTFFIKNFSLFAKNQKIVNDIINKYGNDIDFNIELSKKEGFNALLNKWDIISSPENEMKIYDCLLEIGLNTSNSITFDSVKEVDDFHEIIEKLIKFKNGRFLAYLLIEVVNYRRYIDSRKKRQFREWVRCDNVDFALYKKRVNINNVSEIVQNLNIIEDYGEITDLLEKKFNFNITLASNPRTINISIACDRLGEILSMIIDESEIFLYHAFLGDDSDFLKIILLMIHRYYLKVGKDNIEKSFVALEEEERIKYEKELKRRAKKTFNELLGIVKKDEVSKTNEEVHLEPCIFINNNFGSQNKLVSFKIGISKLYVIKNYTEFIHNIMNKNYYEYGKSFSFNHNIDSFDEKSKELLEMLLGDNRFQSAYYYGDNRYVSISDRNFDKIIKNSSEINLEYGSLPASKLLVMEPIELEIYIDENYNVYSRNKSNCEKLKGFVANGFEYDYFVADGKIYPLISSKELRPIHAKLITSDMNISLIKKEFISEIYARFMDDFVISQEIKSDFDLKDLNIEIYFDYQNGIISYYDKLIVDGKEIKIDKVSNQLQMFKKYNKYQNILNNFGFENNVIDTNDRIYNFLRADFSLLKEIATVFLSENIKNIKAKEYKKTNVYMGYNTGLLDVCFEESEYSEEDLFKIISSLRKKIKYVKLNNNTIVKVSDNEAKELLGIVEELKLDPHHLKTNQKIPLYQSLKLMSDLDYSGIKVSGKIKDMITEISNYKDSQFCVPEKFANVMRDYQIEAYKWIKILSKYAFSGILADDMGLGKSLEIISVLASDEKDMPSLIVCPKSLVYNWNSEFNKWASDIEVYPVIGTSNERHKIMNNYDANKKQAFLISYDSLKNELELFNKFNFRYLILDEAQFIKNHTTLKAQSVKKINSELRFVLTGTPIENSVIDLWSIFDFLMPNYLYNYSEFKSSYEKRIIEKDSEATKKLVMKITPFILRRTKQDVLKDLPEKIETIRIVQMGEEQKKYYDAQLLKTKILLEDSTNKNKNNIEILASLTRLRQLCVDPSMFIDEYNDSSCKVEAIGEIIDEYIIEHKIIIFSQFTKAFINLEKILKEKDVPFAKITGDTTAFERITIANDFNETDKYKVILVSLKAGGTGLNLIGADIVVHLDPWWNIAAENQASDRAHRIGQKNVVQVIKIICKDSIEQKVIELQNAKKDIVNSLITNDDSAILSLSTEDLKYILK